MAGNGGKLEIAKSDKEKLDPSFDNLQNTNGLADRSPLSNVTDATAED
jgi:hypothetical protein